MARPDAPPVQNPVANAVEPDREHDVELAELLDEVRRIDVLSRRVVTDVMAGGWNSAFRGSGMVFDEVREYVPGDDPRSVDWNVTARVGRPFVKQFVEEREQTVLFLFDLSASMDSGFGALTARQMAARVVACLGLSAVRNGDKVGLIACGAEVERHVPAQKGLAHVLRIVRDCLALPPRAPGTDLAAALTLATRAERRRAVVFLVSDFLGEGFERALAPCARRHDVVAVRLLTPALDALPRALVHVVDPETGVRRLVDGRDPRTRGAYERRVATWRARTADALRRAGADLMDVPVPRTADRHMIARPILRFFRMRAERGAKR